ncbi:MAG: hypothetical protein P1V19_09510, partial [Gimesia sp.]|nr:hypothetical protein [Gimesia sp.]
RIASYNESDFPANLLQRLTVFQSEELFDLDFFGDTFEEGCIDLMGVLARSDVAPHIRSLIFRCPDTGANGTRSWDLEPMLETEVSFTNLELFTIQQNQPGDHNCSIIASDFEEDGVLSKLLKQSPNLVELTIPSAPDENFFEMGERPIQFLSVDAGYDTQGFISNLAKSSCFPDLSCLEWGEYNQTHLDDYLERCTSIENYRELFGAKSFAQVSRFVWRNPVCSDEEIEELKMLKPGLELLVVRSSAYYI